MTLERAPLGSVIVRVADHGQFFATRASARKIISERVEALASHEAVILELHEGKSLRSRE